MYKSDTEFEEVYADRNITYGATFMNNHDESADVIEITDLESANGEIHGAVLVSIGQVGFYVQTKYEDYKPVGHAWRRAIDERKSIMQSCEDYPYVSFDLDVREYDSFRPERMSWWQDWRKMTRDERRVRFFEASWLYGKRDIERELVIVHDLESYLAGPQDNWKPDLFVDGEDGLKHYLATNHALTIYNDVSPVSPQVPTVRLERGTDGIHVFNDDGSATYQNECLCGEWTGHTETMGDVPMNVVAPLITCDACFDEFTR